MEKKGAGKPLLTQEKGKDYAYYRQWDLIPNTVMISFLREEDRGPRHIKPSMVHRLKMEGVWCLRLAEARVARGGGHGMGRSAMECEKVRGKP